MKIHDVKQGSEEWLKLRAGIPTASELDALVTPKFAIRKGQGLQTYLATKLAEAWLGGPLPSFQGTYMDIGKILEDEAVPWFELEYGQTINRVGFITTDDGKVGCSPDGLLGDDCGIEIKCPAPHTHVGYLLEGKLPDDYALQVHGSMWVTGFKQWKFMSYCRGFPALVVTIERDEAAIEAIGDGLKAFLEMFEAGMERLKLIDSGELPKSTPLPILKRVETVLAPAPITEATATAMAMGAGTLQSQFTPPILRGQSAGDSMLPDATVEKLQEIIGEKALLADKWFRTQQTPWLLDGQGLQHLTVARAEKIIANPKMFLRSVEAAK